MNHDNPNCDNNKCKRADGEVRLLPTGGDGNMILCRDCYEHEMRYRRERVAAGEPFDLPAWNELKVYAA